MNIKEMLIKNEIEFQVIGDCIATYCPFCEKSYSGRPTLTLNLDYETGNGSCFGCKENFKWEEIAEKFGISITLKEEKIKTEEKKQKSNIPKQEVKTIPAERFKKLKPEKEVTYEEWKAVIHVNFPGLLFASEMGLSILSQILIKDIINPFALVLIDVPSSGKTIAINFFANIDELCYATDKFTPASFVSNAANVAKDKLQEVDLLPRLQYKMFIIRDLATLFSKREDDLNECLGILTRVLDGEGLNTDSGIHGQRKYKGDYLFMILAASTPISGRVWKMMGNLGSRLFFLSLNSKKKSENELADQLTKTVCREKEDLCRNITTDFLKTLWSKYPNGIIWNKDKDQREEIIVISRCAMLLAKLRGVINVWKDAFGEFGSEHTVPVIEMPDRINQLFYNLCRGHALVCGRTQISQDDLRFTIELTIDSAPAIRAKLFRKLIEHNGVMTTSKVEKTMNCSKPTALGEMEKLRILGVVEISEESYGQIGGPEKEIRLAEEFKWFLSEECKKIRGEN